MPISKDFTRSWRRDRAAREDEPLGIIRYVGLTAEYFGSFIIKLKSNPVPYRILLSKGQIFQLQESGYRIVIYIRKLDDNWVSFQVSDDSISSLG